MSDKFQQSIADSLEIKQHLLGYMPYLLQDMWALGSSMDQILDAVASLKLPRATTTVLDLGCGKGAVSVHIAENFSFRVLGIDAMSSFLDDARKKAKEYKVDELCEFRKADIHEFVADEHDFDIVILASLGGVLGSLKDTVAKLRSQVRVGGYIIIDDGFLKKKKSLDRKGYGHYNDYSDTIKALTFFKDRIVKEIDTTSTSKDINEKYLVDIKKRIEELIKQKPELAEDLNAYYREQEVECEVLERDIVGMLWLIQKSDI